MAWKFLSKLVFPFFYTSLLRFLEKNIQNMNLGSLPLLEEITKNTDDLITFLLTILPTEQNNTKDLSRNKVFVINFLLLLAGKDKIPYLDLGLGGIAGSFPQDLKIVILPKHTTFSPIKFSMTPSVYFILHGKLQQNTSIYSKISKRFTKRPKVKLKTECMQELEPTKIIFLKNDTSIYTVEEEVHCIQLDEQKYNRLLIMIEGEFFKVISTIAMNLLKISKYELKTFGVVRKIVPLLLNKSHSIQKEYSLIYVQNGEILCQNLKKGYRYTIGKGSSVDVLGVEKEWKLTALQKCAVLCFPHQLIEYLMEELPEFSVSYQRQKRKRQEINKRVYSRVQDKMFQQKKQKRINYCCFQKKLTNRFSVRKNSPEFYEKSQPLTPFMVDAQASEAIVSSKKKMLETREQKQKIKTKKTQNQVLPNHQMTKHNKKTEQVNNFIKKYLTCRNTIIFNSLKKENNCSGFKNKAITSAMIETPVSSCQETLFSSNDTELIHKMLMNETKKQNQNLTNQKSIQVKIQKQKQSEKCSQFNSKENINDLKKRTHSYRELNDNGEFVLTMQSLKLKKDYIPIHSNQNSRRRRVLTRVLLR